MSVSKVCKACNTEFSSATGRRLYCITCCPSTTARLRYLRTGVTQPKFEELCLAAAGICIECCVSPIRDVHKVAPGVWHVVCKYCLNAHRESSAKVRRKIWKHSMDFGRHQKHTDDWLSGKTPIPSRSTQRDFERFEDLYPEDGALEPWDF